MEIIAEIGQNHNGDMGLAKELIYAAKECGASTAKFQLYDAVKLFPPKSQNEWFDYNVKTELKRDQINLLAEDCAQAGIEFMASVFDIERIAWLEAAKVKRYKVASRSIYEKELINALTATNKPLLISLGHWKEKEFPVVQSKASVEFLYCISKYPTDFTDLGFSKVDFNKYVGFSDHTLGIHAPQIALSRGAKIIEKHFTIDKKMYGPDHSCSMTPDELRELSSFMHNLQKSL